MTIVNLGDCINSYPSFSQSYLSSLRWKMTASFRLLSDIKRDNKNKKKYCAVKIRYFSGKRNSIKLLNQHPIFRLMWSFIFNSNIAAFIILAWLLLWSKCEKGIKIFYLKIFFVKICAFSCLSEYFYKS